MGGRFQKFQEKEHTTGSQKPRDLGLCVTVGMSLILLEFVFLSVKCHTDHQPATRTTWGDVRGTLSAQRRRRVGVQRAWLASEEVAR